MLDFTPPPSDKKRRGGRDDEYDGPAAGDDEDKDDKEVCWLYVDYPAEELRHSSHVELLIACF